MEKGEEGKNWVENTKQVSAFHTSRLEFVVIGSLTLFAEIGLVAIKHGVKHFVILGDVEIVVGKGACEYLLC